MNFCRRYWDCTVVMVVHWLVEQVRIGRKDRSHPMHQERPVSCNQPLRTDKRHTSGSWHECPECLKRYFV